MKWKSRAKRKAEVGDTRVRTTFALMPMRAENGYTYWLTKVVLHERLMRKLKRRRGGFVDEEEKWVAYKTEVPED